MRQFIFSNWSGMQEDSGLWDYYILANRKLKKKKKIILVILYFSKPGDWARLQPTPNAS